MSKDQLFPRISVHPKLSRHHWKLGDSWAQNEPYFFDRRQFGERRLRRNVLYFRCLLCILWHPIYMNVLRRVFHDSKNRSVQQLQMKHLDPCTDLNSPKQLSFALSFFALLSPVAPTAISCCIISTSTNFRTSAAKNPSNTIQYLKCNLKKLRWWNKKSRNVSILKSQFYLIGSGFWIDSILWLRHFKVAHSDDFKPFFVLEPKVSLPTMRWKHFNI